MRNFKIIIIVALVLPMFAVGQKKHVWNKPLYDSYKFHFGFGFTLGMLDFSVAHSKNWYLNDTTQVYSVVGQAKPIFGASMVTNFKLNDFVDLRFIPGLAFGQRDISYVVDVDGDVNGSAAPYYKNMKIESTYLQFPVLVKYRAMRESNYRPYLVGGVNYTLDLATRKKVKEDELPKIRLKQHDILLELGAGVDFYLPYFKFSTELKFSYGLMNIVDYKYVDNEVVTIPYAQIFDRLGTKMVTLVIYFE